MRQRKRDEEREASTAGQAQLAPLQLLKVLRLGPLYLIPPSLFPNPPPPLSLTTLFTFSFYLFSIYSICISIWQRRRFAAILKRSRFIMQILFSLPVCVRARVCVCDRGSVYVCCACARDYRTIPLTIFGFRVQNGFTRMGYCGTQTICRLLTSLPQCLSTRNMRRSTWKLNLMVSDRNQIKY